MLQRGDIVRHFDVQSVDGEAFSYSGVWQRRNLVLVTLSPAAAADDYVSGLKARDADFSSRNSVCVVTCDSVPGLPAPGALVADRWGEVVHVAAPAVQAGLPTAQALLDWVEYVENRCPECEGEAR